MGFVGPQHAYRSGLVLGMALAHGLAAEPVLDEFGNYQPVFTIDTTIGKIRIIVDPPEEMQQVITGKLPSDFADDHCPECGADSGHQHHPHCSLRGKP